MKTLSNITNLTEQENSIFWARKYVMRIRNNKKHSYATAYLNWIAGGKQGNEPERGALSYMGAQAVRLIINTYFNS